jgi:hypothetical protein
MSKVKVKTFMCMTDGEGEARRLDSMTNDFLDNLEGEVIKIETSVVSVPYAVATGREMNITKKGEIHLMRTILYKESENI